MKKLPDDIAGPLREFVAVSGEVRVVLAHVGNVPGVADDEAVQTYISAIDTLSAASRPHVAPIVDKVGRSPALHFVSSLFAPEGYCIVTKNDRLIWSGPVHSMVSAMNLGKWPGGSTIHLSPIDYGMVVRAMKETREQEEKAS